jgi:hypothetical protein
VFAVECFVRINCVVDMLRAFGRELETAADTKFWRGSISGTKQALCKKKPGRRGTAMMPENVEHMRIALDRNPYRSARRHAVVLQMS